MANILGWTLDTFEDIHNLSYIYLMALHKLPKVISHHVDEYLRDYQPSVIILVTISALYLVSRIAAIYGSLTKGKVLFFFRSLPIIKDYVKKKLDEIGQGIRKKLNVYSDEPYISRLPPKQTSDTVLLKKLKHYQMFDTPSWQAGRISGTIYTNNSSIYNQFLLSVYSSYMWTNPLHSDVFASVRKMESEVIRMVASMYNGDPSEIMGSVTSGGTESIIMACKSYRDYALKVRGISGQPEIVAPVTAHAAFEKGAALLGCKIKHIPIDPISFKVDINKMKRAINSNTCMLVASAPNFPYGIIDPIERIAKIGMSRGIPVHVDACLGGFLIPFMEGCDFKLDEKFDFRVPGVTSISADTHKYGYAPKGTSVILYREKKYIHQQYSIQTDWPGGLYASPTIPGSRPGGLIATCWAAMLHHGQEGYVNATRSIIESAQYIRRELHRIEGIRVLGDPQVSVIAFDSDKFNIYELNDRLNELGWNLNILQHPPALHICVTLMHTGGKLASSFVREVTKISEELLKDSRKPGKEIQTSPEGTTAIYGMAETISDRSLVAEVCTIYLDATLGH